MKPGYKTSEFWLNLLVFLLGAALASGLLADGGHVAKTIGGALSLLSAIGYTAARTGVKRADALGAAYVSKASLPAPDPTKESA